MHKVGPSLFFIFLFLIFVANLAAGIPNEPKGEGLLTRVQLLEETLSRIETQDEKIATQDAKILAELDQLRIWMRRRPRTAPA